MPVTTLTPIPVAGESRSARRGNHVAGHIDDMAPGETRHVRTGASRFYLSQLQKRFPELSWSHTKAADGTWDVYAQRVDW